MGINFAAVKEFPASHIIIDFSFLQHNQYGFQTISCKTQSKIFAHFITEVKKDLSYLENTKRPRDVKADIVLAQMVQQHQQGKFLVGKQIEHFAVKGYIDKNSTEDSRKKCECFRIFGIREGTRFFVIRIDPTHKFPSRREIDFGIAA